MSPFQEFRFWLRRAPSSERVAAGIGAALAVALVAWLLVPKSSTSSTDVLSAGAATTGAGASAATPSAGATPTAGTTPTVLSGSVPATPTAGGSSSAAAAVATPGASAPRCASPPGSATGVTASQIKVAVSIVNIVGPAANSIFGIAQPAQQQAAYQAIIDSVNAEGGVACRKLVPQYFTINPASRDELVQKCRDIADAGVFAFIDAGAYAQFPEVDCYAQEHLPYFGGYFITADRAGRGYPYLFNMNNLDTLYKDTVYALRDRGFFTAGNGFQKLGFVYHDCDKPLLDSFTGWLHQAGLTDAQIVPYDVGCPTTFASPSDLAAAVLKFRQNGVTHVTDLEFLGDFANFTNIAEQQGFRPKYGLADDALIQIAYGSQAPNASNIANAIAVTASRDAEERTPGMSPSAATARCDKILTAKGMPPTYKEPAAIGNACGQFWMFKAALENAPTIRQDALAAGLQKAHTIDFSFPQGPNDFSGNRVTTGGQFWRTAQFMPACTCWQLIDRTFHPGYA